MRHAQSRFSIFGGQRPVTCERYNICTVTGEGTSFWNIDRHSFRTCCVSSRSSYKDLRCVKYNQLICDVRRQKVHSNETQTSMQPWLMQSCGGLGFEW